MRPQMIEVSKIVLSMHACSVLATILRLTSRIVKVSICRDRSPLMHEEPPREHDVRLSVNVIAEAILFHRD